MANKAETQIRSLLKLDKVAKIQAHREEVEKSFQNYLRHRQEGHPTVVTCV
jgi:hypothetical protein